MRFLENVCVCVCVGGCGCGCGCMCMCVCVFSEATKNCFRHHEETRVSPGVGFSRC